MENVKRYIKQIKLEGFGIEAQEKLSKARLLIIGAGGLGCPAITYLAAAGLGKIGIIDHDLVEETNLHRQPLYTSEDIGKAKAVIAATQAGKLNPNAEVVSIPEKITVANAMELIQNFDLVLDCTDNYETRYLINDACIILNKPWIYGAVETWEGQLAVFNYLLPDGTKTASYRCIFPEPDLDSMSCDDLGVIGTMPGTIGVLQANEAIKAITGIGKIQGRLLIINLLNNAFQSIKIARNEDAISQIKALRTDYTGFGEEWLEQISPAELGRQPGKYFVIDIREEYEVDELPYQGTNVHIPVYELIAEGYNFQKDVSYVLLCATGARSLQTSRKLKEKYPGIHISVLVGGVEATVSR